MSTCMGMDTCQIRNLQFGSKKRLAWLRILLNTTVYLVLSNRQVKGGLIGSCGQDLGRMGQIGEIV